MLETAVEGSGVSVEMVLEVAVSKLPDKHAGCGHWMAKLLGTWIVPLAVQTCECSCSYIFVDPL